MSDDRGGLGAQRTDQTHDVIDQCHHPVILDIGWLGRPAVPTYVEGHRAVPSACQRRQLMAPRVRRLREPVDQQHQWALALFHHMQSDISQYHAVSHRGSSLLVRTCPSDYYEHARPRNPTGPGMGVIVAY